MRHNGVSATAQRAYSAVRLNLPRSVERGAVIFEVWPDPVHREGYLNCAAELKTELLKMDGFTFIERFESLSEPGKPLSLQF